MITVILPVHNSEKYLKECIESVINQTMQDLEILCIDGGSIDLSLSIIEAYADNDSRFRILLDNNTSYGHKLNLGIEKAKGEYIAIVETDDVIETNTLEKLYSIAIEKDVDFVSADYYSFFDVNGVRFRQKTKKLMDDENYDKVLEGSNNIKLISRSGIAIWTGLYKKSFLINNEIHLNETMGAAYQDTGFSFMVLLLANRTYHLKDSFYNYRIDNVGSSVKNQKSYGIIVDEYKFISNELLKRKISNDDIWNEYYIKKYNGFIWNIRRLTNENQFYFYDMFVEEIKKDRVHGYPKADDNNRLILSNLDEKKEDYIKYINELPMDSFHVFQELMNEMNNRRLIIMFGSGKDTEQIILLLPEEIKDNIKYICDNDMKKWNSYSHGIKIINPIEACAIEEALFVIANKNSFMDMEKQLLGNGIKKKDIVIYNDFIQLELIQKINMDERKN